MGVAYSVDGERGMVCTRGWGELTTEDLQRMYRVMLTDPRIRPGFRQLADWRDITTMSVDRCAVREAAQSHVFGAHVRRAIVVASDVAYGIARMFATYSDDAGQDVAVFQDMASARLWLEGARLYRTQENHGPRR